MGVVTTLALVDFEPSLDGMDDLDSRCLRLPPRGIGATGRIGMPNLSTATTTFVGDVVDGGDSDVGSIFCIDSWRIGIVGIEDRLACRLLPTLLC